MAYNNLIKGRTDEEVRRMIEEGIPQMLHALAVSTPSGGQSNNACNSEPAAVLIEIRPRKNDFTYMNAFEEPVRADKNGTITRNGVQKLLNESIGFEKRQGSVSKYAIETSHWLWFTKEEGIRFPEGFGGGKAENFDNLGDLYDRLEEIIREES